MIDTPKTTTWGELETKEVTIENEELLLRNTFLNSKNAPQADFSR